MAIFRHKILWISAFFSQIYFHITQKERLETHIAPKHIVGIGCDVPSQSKITDLCHSAVSQQNVSRCKIPVDTLYAQTHMHRSGCAGKQTEETTGIVTCLCSEKLILNMQNRAATNEVRRDELITKPLNTKGHPTVDFTKQERLTLLRSLRHKEALCVTVQEIINRNAAEDKK